MQEPEEESVDMKLITDVVESSNLSNVHCSICESYLSVAPISINIQNGESICGRCITNYRLNNHIFEVLVKQFLIPCAYTTEGCLIAQSIENINKHEKSCTYRTLKCYCYWSGNTYDFIKHFEKQHPECVVGNGSILIISDYIFVLFRSRGLFFYLNCLYRDDILVVRIIGVTNSSKECNGKFKCEQLDTNLITEIAVESIVKLRCTRDSPKFTFELEIVDDIVANIFKSIICPNCLVQMTPPILRCPIGHISCLQCSTEWFDYCKICDEECEYTCDSELQCIALGAEFTCRWNCGNQFNCSEIRDHEQGCNKRMYICFHSIDCDWSGYLEDLAIHDTTCVATEYGAGSQCLFSLNIPEVSFLGTINYRTIHHLIVYKCCFNVIYDKSNGVTSLYVNHYDIYGFPWFHFEAELTHIEESNFLFNKKYTICHSRGGIYRVDIPQDDILRFGGGQFYKITVRVILLNEEKRNMVANYFYRHFKNYSKL